MLFGRILGGLDLPSVVVIHEVTDEGRLFLSGLWILSCEFLRVYFFNTHACLGHHSGGNIFLLLARGTVSANLRPVSTRRNAFGTYRNFHSIADLLFEGFYSFRRVVGHSLTANTNPRFFRSIQLSGDVLVPFLATLSAS